MNRATKTIVSTIGVILGISGLDHGIFEILQGNQPTESLLINAIGPDHIMWEHGGESAFTILPTFLLTGILAITVGIAMIIWSVWFIDKKRGPLVFFLLNLPLFLFGGGIGAPVLIYPAAGIAATLIYKPLKGWQKTLPERIRPFLAKLWPYTLTIAVISMLVGLFIAITGHIPGVNSDNPNKILAIDLTFVFGGGLGMFLVSYVSGFADDIQRNWENV
ncbi:MAG: hypothetical protein PVJ21_23395 [Anaerolineales bacterium]